MSDYPLNDNWSNARSAGCAVRRGGENTTVPTRAARRYPEPAALEGTFHA